MSRHTVSAIVPVYNGADYLRECLDSLLAEEEPFAEILVIDDGSQDASYEIARKYARQCDRVTVYQKENGGVSSARNLGLSHARGDYIFFADADDTVSPEFLREILSNAEKTDADIVMFDAETDTGDALSLSCFSESTVFTRDMLTADALCECAGAVWHMLYRRELLSGIRFPEGIPLSEDRIFNLHALGCAERISYVKKSYYTLRLHRESAVHRPRPDMFHMLCMAQTELYRIIDTVWDGDTALYSVYRRQLLWGAVGSVQNLYLPESPLPSKERVAHVRKILSTPMLTEALRAEKHPPFRFLPYRLRATYTVCLMESVRSRLRHQ